MASFDEHQLGTATKWKDRIRARLMKTMIDVMSEVNYPQTAYSINRQAEANSVINDVDEHVNRYALAVAIDPTISGDYIFARDANGGTELENIESGVNAIADASIDSELSGLVNPFAGVNSNDVINHRKPKNVQAKDIGTTDLNVIWDPQPGANQYNTRWREKGTSTWSVGAVVAATQPVDSLTTAMEYEFQVQTSYNSNTNQSSWSDIIEFTTA